MLRFCDGQTPGRRRTSSLPCPILLFERCDFCDDMVEVLRPVLPLAKAQTAESAIFSELFTTSMSNKNDSGEIRFLKLHESVLLAMDKDRSRCLSSGISETRVTGSLLSVVVLVAEGWTVGIIGTFAAVDHFDDGTKWRGLFSLIALGLPWFIVHNDAL